MEKENKNDRISPRISETVKAALQHLADLDGKRSISSYVVNVLEKHISDNFDFLPKEIKEKLSKDPTFSPKKRRK